MAAFDDILNVPSPYAGTQLAAAMAAQLGADPTRLAYSSGPVGQALGQISGGFERAQAVDYANQIAAQRQGAFGDLTKALASPDALQYAVNNPNMNPIALSQLLGTSPLQVAQMREAAANAALATTKATGLGNAPPIVPTAGAPATAGPGGPARAPGATGPAIGGGRYPSTETTTLPIEPENVPPDKLQAYLKTLNSMQYKLAIAKMRARATAPPVVAPVAPSPTQ
jgi:hypothetical protein